MSALSEQPPPRRGAKAGYYPDPLRGRRARWWDGQGWTLQVGPLVPPDAPKGKTVSPTTKVCRHCGAQADTFEGTCPNCGKPYGQTNGWVIAAIVAACLIFVIFVGGCAVVFGLLINSTDHRHAISQSEFDSVAIGSTQNAVESRLGSPYNRYQYADGARGPVSCIYYHQEGERRFSRDYYGLCFVQGRLDSKQDHG
jgi:uncharacterized protein DUF2510